MSASQLVLGIGIAAVSACLMEGVAWLLHRFVMHGFLWILHEDHHRPRGHRLQKNDLFAIFFSGLSIFFFALGVPRRDVPLIATAIGVTLYGLGYFLFHDVMFHKRIKGLKLRPFSPYLRRIVRAHARHHQKSHAHDGVSFGFLYARPDGFVEPGPPDAKPA
jgi:beta-carotene 3-hydroxylase